MYEHFFRYEYEYEIRGVRKGKYEYEYEVWGIKMPGTKYEYEIRGRKKSATKYEYEYERFPKRPSLFINYTNIQYVQFIRLEFQ